MVKEKYNYDSAYKKLYVWSDEHNAYLFACSNPYGLTEKELIADYEQRDQ